jgi:hypothetical protein
VILDAGGGTVDAITYSVDRIVPLRLKKAVVQEDGMSNFWIISSGLVTLA